MSVTRDQFERLALEHIDMLYRVARRLTGNDAQAEDLVQETYIRAIRSWQTFQLQDFGIRPWLIRILHNLFYSSTRRDHRQATGIQPEHLESLPDRSHNGTSGVPILTDAFQTMDDRLVRALNRLPSEYQVVMLLWALEELSYKEIADALEIPIGTVMSRLHRAKQKLAEQLADFARDNRILRE